MVLYIRMFCSFWYLGSDRLAEVSETFTERAFKVYGVTLVVSQHPGKDGVLREIVVGSSSDRVQVHEILKVGDSSLHPLFSNVGTGDHLFGGARYTVN